MRRARIFKAAASHTGSRPRLLQERCLPPQLLEWRSEHHSLCPSSRSPQHHWSHQPVNRERDIQVKFHNLPTSSLPPSLPSSPLTPLPHLRAWLVSPPVSPSHSQTWSPRSLPGSALSSQQWPSHLPCLERGRQAIVISATTLPPIPPSLLSPPPSSPPSLSPSSPPSTSLLPLTLHQQGIVLGNHHLPNLPQVAKGYILQLELYSFISKHNASRSDGHVMKLVSTIVTEARSLHSTHL